jgi:hypothetical protein
MTPKTWEASNELFGPPLTQWCTAASEARGRGYFKDYSSKGPLYSIRDKTQIVQGGGKGEGQPKPVVQVHFPDEQFMDEHDNSIDFATWLKDKPGLKKFFQPIFKKELGSVDFDLDKEIYQWYIQLYGAGEDIKRIAEESLQGHITSKQRELKVVDEGNSRSEVNIKNYVAVYGSYEATLERVFHYMKPSITNFEIKLKNYKGGGVDIPEKIHTLKGLSQLVFTGFVKTLPDVFSQFPHLTMLVLRNNPHLSALPPSVEGCENLTIMNIAGTRVQLSPTMEERANGDLIVISE